MKDSEVDAQLNAVECVTVYSVVEAGGVVVVKQERLVSFDVYCMWRVGKNVVGITTFCTALCSWSDGW